MLPNGSLIYVAISYASTNIQNDFCDFTFDLN